MSATSTYNLEDIPKKYIDPLAPRDKGEGSRVNGKDYKIKKDAFRVKTLGIRKVTNFKDRELLKKQDEQFKAKLNELKSEKEATKQERISNLKKRRETKAEKERYERLALKFKAKKLERLKKKEKRNKLLKER